jgi:hypothetical protein
VKQEQELGIVVKAKEVWCWHSGIMTDYVNVYVHEFEAWASISEAFRQGQAPG